MYKLTTLFFLAFYAATSISCMPTQPQPIIVLDLHGVVLSSNKGFALRSLGKINVLSYLLSEKIAPHKIVSVLKNRVYELMETIKPFAKNQKYRILPCDDAGAPLPQHMINFLDGSQNPDEILKELTDFIIANPLWFKHKSEQQLIFNFVHLLFTPKLFCQLYTIRPEAIHFVKKCKKRGFRVAILSNFDTQTFNLIKDHNKEFFNLFDPHDICISADCHTLKPDASIYTFFNQFNVPYNQIWFIDDQKENIIIPKIMGVHTILFEAKKYCGGLFTKYPAFPTMQSLRSSIPIDHIESTNNKDDIVEIL